MLFHVPSIFVIQLHTCKGNVPSIIRNYPGNGFEQSAFTTTVLTDYSQQFAFVYRKGNVVQNGFAVVAGTKVFYVEHFTHAVALLFMVFI
jgi:hypothetical protein